MHQKCTAMTAMYMYFATYTMYTVNVKYSFAALISKNAIYIYS